MKPKPSKPRPNEDEGCNVAAHTKAPPPAHPTLAGGQDEDRVMDEQPTTFGGKPIIEMTREELLAVIEYLSAAIDTIRAELEDEISRMLAQPAEAGEEA